MEIFVWLDKQGENGLLFRLQTKAAPCPEPLNGEGPSEKREQQGQPCQLTRPAVLGGVSGHAGLVCPASVAEGWGEDRSSLEKSA